MKKIKSTQIDMTEGPILGKLLSFAFPVMFSGLLQLLFNAADIIVVGKFAGDLCLAAVGSNGALVHLIVNLFIGLAIGSNVLCARYIGAKKINDVEETVHTSITLALIAGVILTIVGIFVSTPLLKLMDTPENVLPLASEYLKIYFLSMPAMMLYNYGAALLRADGDTKRPLVFLTISGVVNVALNLYFVIGLGMDVDGVGYATVISQYISAVLIIMTMLKETNYLKLDIKKLGIKKDKAIQILKIGIPTGITGTFFSISNIVIQSSINSFGSVAVAGSSAVANIEGFIYTALAAFGSAGMSFTSQNVGAGKYDRLKPIMYRAMDATCVMGLILGAIMYFFPEKIISIYTDTPEAISYGLIRASIVCVPYVLDGFMDSMGSIIRGLGYSLAPMIITLLSVCVFRVLWISIVFNMPQYHTLEAIYISYPISWILAATAETACYYIIFNKHFKGRL